MRPTALDLASRTKPMAKKHFIQAATKNAHGQFRAKAEAAGETTREFAQQHKGDDDTTGQQARLAINLMGLSHKRKKLYDHPRSKG